MKHTKLRVNKLDRGNNTHSDSGKRKKQEQKQKEERSAEGEEARESSRVLTFRGERREKRREETQCGGETHASVSLNKDMLR